MLTMVMMMKTMTMMVMIMIIWWESCVEAASELLSHRGSFTMEGGRQKQWVQLKNMMLMPMMIELFFIKVAYVLILGIRNVFFLLGNVSPTLKRIQGQAWPGKVRISGQGQVLLVEGVKWWRWSSWRFANQRFLRPPPTAKRPCSLSLANYAFWKSRAMRIFFKKTFHLLGGVPVADIQHHLLLSCCIGDVRMWFKWWQVWEQGFLGKASLITFAKG